MDGNEELSYLSVPVETEQSVLGSILIDSESVLKVMDILKPEDFHYGNHRVIFNSMLELLSSNIPIDVITLSDRLEKVGQLDKIGGSYYLTELIEVTQSPAQIVHHAKIILEKSKLAKLVLLSDDAKKSAYGGVEYNSIAEKLSSELFALSAGDNNRILFQNFGEARKNLMLERAKKDFQTHPKSGYDGLDRMLVYGFQPGLTVIAGRPGMGKTEIKINLIDHWLKTGVGVYDLSPEMGAARELDRLDTIGFPEISTEQLYKSNTIPNEMRVKLKERWRWYDESFYWLDDTPLPSFYKLFFRVKLLKSQYPELKIVVIDVFEHLYEVAHATKNRQSILSGLVADIFNRGREIGVCFLVIHHLGRQLESRRDKTPRMSDLFDTSAMEKFADLLLFVHRPSVYDVNFLDESTHLIIGKQRDGGRFTGKSIRLGLKGDHKFEELQEDDSSGDIF